jgi:hypothetical protein
MIDLRILHSILYSKMLLQTYTSVSNYQYGIPQPSSSVMEDEHNNEAIYFVSSIMRVIQVSFSESVLQIYLVTNV